MFIRYNEALDFWEYDTSAGQTGAGPWVILPVNAAYLIGGGVPANVALLDRPNQIFVSGQSIDGKLQLGNTTGGYIVWNNPAGAADARKWHQFTRAADGGIQIYPVNDTETGAFNQGFVFGRDGSLTVTNKVAAVAVDVNGPNSIINIIDSSSPANKKWFRFVNYSNGRLILESLTDASGLNSQPIWFDPSGVVGIGTYLQTGGVQFVSAQSNPLLLDRYEEGTWNPRMYSDAGGEVTVYTERLGKYTRIGNIVHLTFSVSFSNHSMADGNIILADLPFMVRDNYFVGGLDYWGTTTPFVHMQLHVPPSNAIIYFPMMNSSGNTNPHQSYLRVSSTVPGIPYRGQVTYRTDT